MTLNKFGIIQNIYLMATYPKLIYTWHTVPVRCLLICSMGTLPAAWQMSPFHPLVLHSTYRSHKVQRQKWNRCMVNWISASWRLRCSQSLIMFVKKWIWTLHQIPRRSPCTMVKWGVTARKTVSAVGCQQSGGQPDKRKKKEQKYYWYSGGLINDPRAATERGEARFP